MSKITNDRLNPVWHRMLYSCTCMAAVGVKGSKTYYSTELWLLSHHGPTVANE